MHLTYHLVLLVGLGTLLSDAANFLTAPFRGAAELAGNVWHAIRALFIKLRDVFGHLWDAWTSLYHGLVAFGRAAIHFARNVVSALGWVVETALPSIGRWAVAKAEHYADVAATFVAKQARRFASWVKDHAERLVHLVEKLAQHLYRVLLRSLTSAWHWIRRAGHTVYQLVMHPQRLVAWILPHLILPLLRFAVSHSQPIVRWLVRFALRESLALADTVESELTRIL